MSKFIVSICILSLVGNVKNKKNDLLGRVYGLFGVNSKSYFYSTLKKKIMKAMKFSFMRSIAVW